eukprot:TRINITY_DN18555_c0_g1_i1.p1 TRINITY_DN18555_c0_g1~~TRINITY_DN18555_c0_g1_i1.p1  ORF type:complete len:131 (+),score=8.13 TRINITY_DN18555_c0_g1_i1:110-502(+)
MSYQEQLPLFGEDSRRVKTFDLLYGIVTGVCVLVTVILSLTHGHIEVINYFFGVAIFLVSLPQWILVIWFRKGDLDPKFRYLIAYMTVSIVTLCVCAVIYLHRRDTTITEPCATTPTRPTRAPFTTTPRL